MEFWGPTGIRAEVVRAGSITVRDELETLPQSTAIRAG